MMARLKRKSFLVALCTLAVLYGVWISMTQKTVRITTKDLPPSYQLSKFATYKEHVPSLHHQKTSQKEYVKEQSVPTNPNQEQFKESLTKKEYYQTHITAENGNNSYHYQKQQNPLPSTRTNVFILSQGRGGSSLLGEIFNNNLDVMYVFEPLHIPTKRYRKATESISPANYRKLCFNVLDSFFKCNFSKIQFSLPEFSTSIFRLRSKALTSDMFCTSRRRPLYAEDLKKPDICAKLTNSLLSRVCSSYKHTVVKVLTSRLPGNSLESFRDLIEERSGYTVKIINLIRDPRAVVYSWFTLNWILQNYTDPGFRQRVHSICKPIERNLLLGLSSPEWLSGRFTVIRYEDLVANITDTARQLYAYAGFDWSIKVEKWIEENQRNPSQTESKNPYSTYRNSSVIMNKWKNAPQRMIRVVEEICSGLMKIMGYQKWENGEN